jgi:gamma-tubulin complex component 3
LNGGLGQTSADGFGGGLGAFGGGGGAWGGEGDETMEKEGGLRLWENKYQFRREMLPAFVDEAFGKKIFSTGKSLNFIRYSCHDSDWIATREKLGNTGDSTFGLSGDLPSLTTSTDTSIEI